MLPHPLRSTLFPYTTLFRSVHAGEEKLAGVAGFDADVGQLLGNVDRQFAFLFFAACGAEDSPELPFLGAKGTEQEAFSAVAFGAQYTEQRASAAQGTNAHGCH